MKLPSSAKARSFSRPHNSANVQAWGDFVERSYPCGHKRLKEGQRCLGCGRTRSEVELDGDDGDDGDA
jgi:hypothetical protein